MASKRFQEVEKSGKFILIEGIDYCLDYYLSAKNEIGILKTLLSFLLKENLKRGEELFYLLGAQDGFTLRVVK